MAEVRSLARHLADSNSPRSMAIIKRQMRLAYRQELPEALAIAKEEMATSFKAADFKEGVRSFMDRRSLDFSPV